MLVNNNILVGKNDNYEALLHLKMANRHGLITGASGSGKTITLKVLAESFSAAGVPVILSDIKGDLAGTALLGNKNENVESRIKKLNIENFKYQKFPATFFDIFGEKGHPIRITVSSLGSRLLSRLLGLTDTQEGVLAIVFKICEDEKLELIDLKDLKAALNYIGEKRNEYTLNYGNITSQSIGAIQRNILALESEDGDFFFGNPSFDLKDFIHFDENTGFGNINIIDSQKLFQKPTLYSTFLLWLLTNVYNNSPEVGDLDKPKLVIFFDEAHLIFNELPNYILKSIVQIVKLIRSKGVGLYFISQSPSDIPEEILGQLGNRIQHTLRSYTKSDEKIIKAAADSFRENKNFNTFDEIKMLATGEALISCLNELGEPNIVEKVKVLPPQSKMGPIVDELRNQLIKESWLYQKYENIIDNESAFEKINNKNKTEETKGKIEVKSTTSKKTTTKKSRTEKMVDKFTTSTINNVSRKLTNELFKSFFKK